jgi:DNA-binding CsgD family transcriptional regulator
MRPLDDKTLARLRKIWAMRGSAHEGEVQAAESRAAHLVQAFGYSLADIPGLLANAGPGQARPEARDWRTGFTGFGFAHDTGRADPRTDRSGPEKERARQEYQKEYQEYAARTRKLAELLRRYGGIEKVRAWQPREALLRAAVRPWSVLAGPHGATFTLAGGSLDDYLVGNWTIPDKVRRALGEAYPLPKTITEAVAEMEYWTGRDEELGLLAAGTVKQDSHLDLPCALRREIVQDLLWFDLPAATIGELWLRYRRLDEDDLLSLPEAREAIKRDLAQLAARERAQGDRRGAAQPGRSPRLRTASARRAEVEKYLASAAGKPLSDREIARRVGVSPQTVGNIRRKMEAASK